MAIVKIQHRRGNYADFDPTKLLPAELAVVQNGDPSSSDGEAIYISPKAGSVKQLATKDQMQSEIETILATELPIATAAATAEAEAAADRAEAAAETLEIDDTLSHTGQAADAKATGDAISDLSSALNILENTFDPYYPDFYDLKEVFGGFELGDVNPTTGHDIIAENFYRTKYFCPIDSARILRGQWHTVGSITAQRIVFYNVDYSINSVIVNSTLQSMTIPVSAKYVRFVITKNQYNNYVTTDKCIVCFVPTASTVPSPDNLVNKFTLNGIKQDYVSFSDDELLTDSQKYLARKNIDAASTENMRRVVCDNLLPTNNKLIKCNIPPNTPMVFSRRDGGMLNDSELTNKPYLVFYDENRTQIASYSSNVNATYRAVHSPSDAVAYYINWSSTPSTDYMINYGTEPLPWQEYYPPILDSVEDISNDINLLANSEKGYIHIASAGTIRTTKNSNGSYTITFGKNLILCFPGNDTRTAVAWDDISANIASSIVITGNSAAITVGAYKALVLDTSDYKLYIRTPAQIKSSDFVILANGSYAAQGWAINIENYQLRLTSDDVLIKEGTGKYNTYENGFSAAIADFSASVIGLADHESFLFVTDPHIFGIGDIMTDATYQKRISNIFAAIETCYKSSPAMFALYGGDWLNNSDTPEIAASKLGMIRGAVNNTMPAYLLVGNHDTNYQGTERLSIRSIKNLWYNGKNSYYKFNGISTSFYCFDTDVENRALDAQDEYGRYQIEQAAWFAESLLTETSVHTAIAVHILFPSKSAPSTLQPLSNLLLSIAKAYNDGSTITFNGVEYNYANKANADGKVEFLIAGHTHVDGSYLYQGIPCVITKNAFMPNNSNIALDFITVDYDNSLIKTFRVGNGNNRVIDMTTGQLVT